MSRRYLQFLPVITCSMALGVAGTGVAREPARPAPRDRGAEMDCSLLKRQPMATMTVADCEAMKASHAALTGAMATPGGERPGDEAMTCEQIIDEMRSSHFAGVSQGTAQEGQAAGEDLQATLDRRIDMAKAMAARQAATTAATALAPNAVQGAVAAAQAAEQQALAADATREMKSARGRTMAANAASARELSANLEASPRFVRLMQLVMAKNCPMNDPPPQ